MKDLADQIDDALLEDAARRTLGVNPDSIRLSRRERIFAEVVQRNIEAARVSRSDLAALRRAADRDEA
jgi:hypothetical protein